MSLRKVIVVAVLAAAVLAGLSLYGDVGELSKNLGGFNWWAFVAACGLAIVNYALRFLRWLYYMARLGIRVPLGENVTIFVAGFVMSVTPGKVGEVLKAALLRDRGRATIAASAPMVVAERLTDVVSIAVLIVTGVFTFAHGVWVLVAAGVLVAVFVALVGIRPLANRVIALFPARMAAKLHEAYESMYVLVTPGPLAVGTLIGIAAWFAECVAFYVVIRGLAGAPAASLFTATFIYALSTLAGALSMLPGGLGVTEGSMAGLLQEMVGGLARASAVAATLLVRFATLWLAVGIGFVALVVFRRGLKEKKRLSF